MRLIRFRVTNFRSVVDSDWIEAERVTALIGVNESGKTNLLLPLWKLNPAREGEIKPTSDYPKANFAAIRGAPGEYKFIEAEFEISDFMSEELAHICSVSAAELKVVIVSRAFDGKHSLAFPNHQKQEFISREEIENILSNARSEIETMCALNKEGALKDNALRAIQGVLDSSVSQNRMKAADLDSAIRSIAETIPDPAAPTSSITPRLRLLVEQLAGVHKSLSRPAPSDLQAVARYVLTRLPKFVYYSNYGNLDSEIYLPHVVENLERDDLGAKEAAKARTLKVLFNFVRLQPKEILELGQDVRETNGRSPSAETIAEVSEGKRERTILLNSAGTDLTKKFADWWKQGDYTFEFQADGDHFRIWVSDKRRPEKIELEDRSSGLQWFLSFYLIFLVESSGDHQNAILLLDEPGLSLHPLAQRDLSSFFENLAKTNQIIYTTHSPFLVDADMLDRVRKVFVSDDGSTKASADLRRGNEDPRKSGATYAIYSALNMSLAESILHGCYPIIVEGPSDQHYLTLIKTLLIAAKLIHPRREIVFPPCHGASNAKAIASILGGKDGTLPDVLLDADGAGQKMARDLQNGLYKDEKQKVKTTAAYVKFANSEIEDLIPATFIVAAVDRWGRKADTPFEEVVQPDTPIVPQIERWALAERVDLYEGWKVDISREVKRRLLEGRAPQVDADVLNNWARLFRDLAPQG